MPVDTESDKWNSASAKNSTKANILDFLKSNPDQAFTPEEISLEVIDSDFELDIPEENLPIEEMLGVVITRTQYTVYTEAFIKTHLSSLVYEGEIEVRVIPTQVEEKEVDAVHYTIQD
ncbi:hypothetical protein [Haloarcula montana]|uniref:hypothetical protein n=1 Tax=Haloarcula montana TaxID=3111776 RepID=UPI002D769907|nr:hypothetical protein [Haloarcula sp. GH36]